MDPIASLITLLEWKTRYAFLPLAHILWYYLLIIAEFTYPDIIIDQFFMLVGWTWYFKIWDSFFAGIIYYFHQLQKKKRKKWENSCLVGSHTWYSFICFSREEKKQMLYSKDRRYLVIEHLGCLDFLWLKTYHFLKLRCFDVLILTEGC